MPLLVALLLLAPRPGSAQRIGLFFDEEGTLCEAPIAYFDVVHVYVVGFPPADSSLSGALFSLELPPNLEVLSGTLRVRRELVQSVSGDVDALQDLNLRFVSCVETSEPLPMLEFDLWEGSQSLRHDLRVRLTGAALDSLLVLAHPTWKICEPTDPEGFSSLVTAPSVDAVFNCTRACYCTTAVRNATWSVIKSLYQGN
jgi:hypothetical protein